MIIDSQNYITQKQLLTDFRIHKIKDLPTPKLSNQNPNIKKELQKLLAEPKDYITHISGAKELQNYMTGYDRS